MRLLMATAIAVGLSLGVALADGAKNTVLGPISGAQWVICVGKNACSRATDQRCSVALGDDVQFTSRSSHVLATRDGVIPLGYINERVEATIDMELSRYGLGPLASDYVAQWNAACTAA